MTPGQSPSAQEVDAEISSLIATLHASGRRLEELTGGEVDAVADSEGRAFLLGRAQDLLRHGDAARQAAILNALPANIALLDERGLIVSVNDAWRRFGHADAIQHPGYAVGLNYLEICASARGWGSSGAREAADGIRAVLAGNARIFSIEYSCHSPARQRWLRMTVTPLAEDHPNGAVVMHVDVTAEKRGEESLRASELRFRQMAENIGEVFWLSDPVNHLILYVSPAYEEIWGRSCESLYASPGDWSHAIHPEDRERVMQAAAMQASGKYAEEYRIVRPDGTIRWIRDRAFPVVRNAAEIYRIAGLAEDITEQKLAKDELRESERRFSSTFSNIHLLSVMLDQHATILYCNDYMLRLTGWKREEVIGRYWFDQFVPHELDNLKGTFADLLKDIPAAWHHQNEILTRAGPRLLIRWNNTVLRSASGEVVGTASIGVDITDQVRLESALRESETGLRRAETVAQLAHVVTRADGSFESWSETLPGLIGADEATMPRSIRGWMDIVHPDDRERYRAAVIAAGSSQARTEIECRVIGRDFERHILQVIEPIQGSAGADGRMRWFSTLQDTSARKRAEEEIRRLNSNLERRVIERTAELQAANQELAAFDYSVSHDLRAPLTRIEGFGAMLGEQYNDKLDEHGRDLLSRMVEAGRSMDRLVVDLFALSTVTQGELHRSRIDMSALAESIVAALRRSEPARSVTFEAAPGMSVRADPGLLRAVLENLLGNAWKFTGRRADARIEIGFVAKHGESTFFVRDNGAGFESLNAAKLFTPFQRLHAAKDFAGTGIGLATVQRIIRRHGGHVWAESIAGEGATFFFTLSASPGISLEPPSKFPNPVPLVL